MSLADRVVDAILKNAVLQRPKLTIKAQAALHDELLRIASSGSRSKQNDMNKVLGSYNIGPIAGMYYKESRMTRAESILKGIAEKAAGNDFSLRIQVADIKKTAALEKQVFALATNIVPDIEKKEITLDYDGDKKHVRINIANVPTSLFDKLAKEISKAGN